MSTGSPLADSRDTCYSLGVTLGHFLGSAYHWADQRAAAILAAGFLFPVLGTALARIGKGGRTDQDGRFIANAVVGVGLGGALIELMALGLAHSALHRSLLEANVMLLAAPVVCLGLCLAGMRWVFPLNELASIQTAVDVGAFALACAGAAWLFSQFRGWGIYFVGNIGQLAAYLVLGFGLLKRLAKRAAGSP